MKIYPLESDSENIKRFGIFKNKADKSIDTADILIAFEKGPSHRSFYWDAIEIEANRYADFFDKIRGEFSEFEADPADIMVSTYIKTNDKEKPIRREKISGLYFPLKKSLNEYLGAEAIVYMRIYTPTFSICADMIKPEFRKFPQVGIVSSNDSNSVLADIVLQLYDISTAREDIRGKCTDMYQDFKEEISDLLEQ